eukprot:g65063.t1
MDLTTPLNGSPPRSQMATSLPSRRLFLSGLLLTLAAMLGAYHTTCTKYAVVNAMHIKLPAGQRCHGPAENSWARSCILAKKTAEIRPSDPRAASSIYVHVNSQQQPPAGWDCARFAAGPAWSAGSGGGRSFNKNVGKNRR